MSAVTMRMTTLRMTVQVRGQADGAASRKTRTVIRRVVILMVTALIVSLRAEWQRPEALPLRPLVFLVLSGLLPAILAVLLSPLEIGPVSGVVSVDKLSVVLVVALSALLVGEPPTCARTSGLALVALARYSSHSDVVVNAPRVPPLPSGSRGSPDPGAQQADSPGVPTDGQLAGSPLQRRHRPGYAGLAVVGVLMSFQGIELRARSSPRSHRAGR